MAKKASFSTAAAKKMMATTAPAKKTVKDLLFAPGAEVEVRSRFTQPAIVSSGAGADREVVIYARATVVSASAGTASYLVRYPAADGTLLPSRVARVPSSDVREPSRRPALLLPPPAAARPPLGAKRAPPPDQQDGDDGCCKKTKMATSGRGIPMDALLRFFEEHEQEAAKKKKKTKARAGTRRRPPRSCIGTQQDAPVSVFLFSPSRKDPAWH